MKSGHRDYANRGILDVIDVRQTYLYSYSLCNMEISRGKQYDAR